MYIVRIRLFKHLGVQILTKWRATSVCSFSILAPEKPASPPVILQGEVTNSSLTFRWAAISNIWGPIQRYKLYVIFTDRSNKVVTRKYTVEGQRTLSLKADSLLPYTVHQISYTAENNGGESEKSNAATQRTKEGGMC